MAPTAVLSLGQWVPLKDLLAEGRLPIPDQAVYDLATLGWIDLDDLVCPPRHSTPAPEVDGAWFDIVEVNRFLECCAQMRHTKTVWAGKPLYLETWQIVYGVAPVFGWRHSLDHDKTDPNTPWPGSRVIRIWVWVIPRKNGKTTIATAVAIYLLLFDREGGPEVYSSAKTISQAKQLFSPAKQMLRASPDLLPAVDILKDVVEVPLSGGFMRILSSIADAAHGLNVHGAVIDEVHVQDREVVETIMTGVGARTQPLLALISTADKNEKGTIFDEQFKKIIGLAAGTLIPEPAFWGAIWCSTEKLDPHDEATWWCSNPNLGISLHLEYLKEKSLAAKNSPASLPAFLRLHTNLRTGSETEMFSAAQWKECGSHPVSERMLAVGRRKGFGALVAPNTGWAAWVMVFPLELEGTDPSGVTKSSGGFQVVSRFWLPANAVDKQGEMGSTVRSWIDAGHVSLSTGDNHDIDLIASDIKDDLGRFNISSYGYFQSHAEDLRQQIAESTVTAWQMGSSITALAQPTSEVLGAVSRGVLHHGAHPILAWCASNAVAKSDRNEQMMLDLPASKGPVAGIRALVGAVAGSLEDKPTPAPIAVMADEEDRSMYGGEIDI